MKNQNNSEESEISKKLLSLIHEKASLIKTVKIMEVCGTHTMEIGKMGLRRVLPSNISLLSGPGCPVCVTPANYIDKAAALALKNIKVFTFGDLIRVPGNTTSLEEARRLGGHVIIASSPLNIIDAALADPSSEYVFLAVGFETTVPSVAVAIKTAFEKKIKNLSFLVCHRIVVPALNLLISDPGLKVSAFLLPGHVTAIIGAKVYEFLKDKDIPGVVSGFKPNEILLGIYEILDMLVTKNIMIKNAYPQVVSYEGNKSAQKIIEEIFEVSDAYWRGIGKLPLSGLKMRKKYEKFDAFTKYGLNEEADFKMPSGCSCGNVLTGKIIPLKCPLFGKECTPENPKGPCMVSSEGSCAAYYRYGS
ncbi:MAG: hypothetical protein ACD_79C00952G0008 [uncultured bacterium]|nr:MAG: hypothetical protein ACD_79C00952G0008 [uncultured bacterium]